MEIRVISRETGMGWRFKVTVSENQVEKSYQVSMDKDFIMRIGTHFPPEKIIKKTFEFLLERESKDKILEDFDIATVSHYYPDFISKLLEKLEY